VCGHREGRAQGGGTGQRDFLRVTVRGAEGTESSGEVVVPFPGRLQGSGYSHPTCHPTLSQERSDLERARGGHCQAPSGSWALLPCPRDAPAKLSGSGVNGSDHTVQATGENSKSDNQTSQRSRQSQQWLKPCRIFSLNFF
jgi:hypothetical protein